VALAKLLDGNPCIITIGQAGEMKMSSAIVSIKDPDDGLRSRGHDGFGEVMASKKVKFITIKPIAKPDKFKEANRTFAKALFDPPVSQALGMYGTNVLVNIINESGRLLRVSPPPMIEYLRFL
jgi:aldehyde:ferredoxin oxidoreductase